MGNARCQIEIVLPCYMVYRRALYFGVVNLSTLSTCPPALRYFDDEFPNYQHNSKDSYYN